MLKDMSSLIAKVIDIQNNDTLHIVKFEAYGVELSMMSLELDPSLNIGANVRLMIKPTHISLAKNFSGHLSDSNQLEAIVTSVEQGKLLSNVKMQFFDTTLESIITSEMLKKLELKLGDKVSLFINASELSISEIIR